MKQTVTVSVNDYSAMSTNRTEIVKNLRILSPLWLKEAEELVDKIYADGIPFKLDIYPSYITDTSYTKEAVVAKLARCGINVTETKDSMTTKEHLKAAVKIALENEHYDVAIKILTILKG